MSLYRIGNVWHYSFYWGDRRYRGSTKQMQRTKAERIQAETMAKVRHQPNVRLTGRTPLLRELAVRFLAWERLILNRRPKPITATDGVCCRIRDSRTCVSAISVKSKLRLFGFPDRLQALTMPGVRFDECWAKRTPGVFRALLRKSGCRRKSGVRF